MTDLQIDHTVKINDLNDAIIQAMRNIDHQSFTNEERVRYDLIKEKQNEYLAVDKQK